MDKQTTTSTQALGKLPAYGAPILLGNALQVATAAEAFAATRGWPVVIAITCSGGHLTLLHRMDQANYGAVTLAQQKAQSAIRFRRSTKTLEEMLLSGPRGLMMLNMAPEVLAVEGGLPLVKGEQIIGAIGISGMTSAQDGEVAAAGAAALR